MHVLIEILRPAAEDLPSGQVNKRTDTRWRDCGRATIYINRQAHQHQGVAVLNSCMVTGHVLRNALGKLWPNFSIGDGSAPHINRTYHRRVGTGRQPGPHKLSNLKMAKGNNGLRVSIQQKLPELLKGKCQAKTIPSQSTMPMLRERLADLRVWLQ